MKYNFRQVYSKCCNLTPFLYKQMWNLSHYNTVIHKYPVTSSNNQTSFPKVILCIDFIIRDIVLHSNLSLNNALNNHVKVPILSHVRSY